MAANGTGGISVAVGDEGLILVSDAAANNSWTHVHIVSNVDLNAVALSEDGQITAIAGENGMIMVSRNLRESWDSIRLERRFSKADFNDIALSNDGNFMIAVGDEGTICVSQKNNGFNWNCGKFKVEDKHPDLHGVSVTGDGGRAIAVGEEGEFLFLSDGSTSNYSIDTWQRITLPREYSNQDLEDIAIVDNSHGTLAVVCGDGIALSLDVFSLNKGKLVLDDIKTSLKIDYYARGIVLNEDGTKAFIVGKDRSFSRIRLSEEDSGSELEASYEISRVESVLFGVKPSVPRKTSYDAVQEFLWEGGNFAYYATISIRIGTILILLFGLQHLSALMRYHSRIATFFDARADAFQLVGNEAMTIGYLERAMHILSPYGLDFERSPNTPMDLAFKLNQLPRHDRMKPSRGE